MRLDALIIGQGLAGSLLAWQMLQRGLRVMVVDSGDSNASQVAAGLINPITGMRLVLDSHIDSLLPAALRCYQQLEQFFNQRFYIEKPMLRLLQTPHELAIAQKRLSQAAYASYLQPALDPTPFAASMGVLQQTQTGYVDTVALLSCLRQYLMANHAYQQRRFDYADLQLQPMPYWQSLQPQQVIFCEGHQARGNPWFGRLPFQVAKGEIVTLASHAPHPDCIINAGYWSIPLQSHRIKTGANFDPVDASPQPTAAAALQLQHALQRVLPAVFPVDVISHQAGIRPTTRDKQPFWGCHPRQPHLHIFNGFGSKGCLNIPWYGQQLINSFDQAVDSAAPGHIQRYYRDGFAD